MEEGRLRIVACMLRLPLPVGRPLSLLLSAVHFFSFLLQCHEAAMARGTQKAVAESA